jgi:hypothetical protein
VDDTSSSSHAMYALLRFDISDELAFPLNLIKSGHSLLR